MLIVQENFLRRFIEFERYIENPPLETQDFIDFCKKRGIETNENELEFFETEGLLYPVLSLETPKNTIPPYRYINILFIREEKNLIISLLENNKIFDPSRLNLHQNYNFRNGESKSHNEKINKYYSSFHIDWLTKLKDSYSLNLNFAGNEIIITSVLSGIFKRIKRISSIENISELSSKLEEDKFEEFDFDLKKKKQILLKNYQYFEKILEFLLSIEYVYAPYGKSSSKFIHMREEIWNEKKKEFDPKEELKVLDFTIKEVVTLYSNFSEIAMEILGIERDDWIQLWKRIGWEEKDELGGYIRLGIEYLQWSIMLKKFIENYCGREIFDINEIRTLSADHILRNDVSNRTMSRFINFTRTQGYYDNIKNENFYDDEYKRLFYLANDFELDYHPRLIVFVEGKTELIILPKFFKFIGIKLENLGIDFINIEGITKFFSKIEIGNSEQDKLILNNFQNLINYTLNKWQTLPFFIGDNEHAIQKFLDEGIVIDFDYSERKEKLPSKWYHIWTKDFELDNFTNKEISTALQSLKC